MVVMGYHASHEQIFPDPVTVPLPGEQPGTEPTDLLRSGTCALGEDSSAELELGGYGFRWLRVHGSEAHGGILPDILTTTDTQKK